MADGGGDVGVAETGAGDEAGAIRTVSFVSLGCPKNLVDSERMLGLLAEDGLIPVSADDAGDDPAELSAAGSEQDASGAAAITPADAVVVNTCGFLEASKAESLSVIGEAVAAKSRGEIKRVVVAGCLVQRHRAKLLDWAPGIDALIGVFDRDKVVEAVRGAGPTRESDAEVAARAPAYWVSGNALTKAESAGMSVAGLTVNGKDGKGIGYFESDAGRLRLTPRHYAYLRVGEGCNQGCAFCTIPSIRGKMRSKGVDAACSEAAELLRDGAFELLLIGQDTTSWGDDIGAGDRPGGDAEGGLPGLLRRLSETVSREAGRGWLRLMYAYPSTFTDGLIEAFRELSPSALGGGGRGHLLPYLDMPLQHASDRMLSAMRRNVSAGEQLELCLKLRERVPGMALRTTLISGFPGETEADHEALLAFVDEVGFDAVGVFAFSPEPGTPAARMDADPALRVPEDVKRRRRGEILELQQSIAFGQAAYLAEQFDASRPTESGCRFEVLIDERSAREDDALRPARRTASPVVNGGGDAERGRGGFVARGRAYFQAPKIDAATFVASREALSPGELIECVVVGSEGYDLIARPASELEGRVRLPVLSG